MVTRRGRGLNLRQLLSVADCFPLAPPGLLPRPDGVITHHVSQPHAASGIEYRMAPTGPGRPGHWFSGEGARED